MSIDLSQFHQVFFEESFEGLDAMESALMELDPSSLDFEVINTIFRSAHSIKGGSATFGFSVVADFTHILETLLDEIREGTRGITQDHIDLFLQSVDCLRELLSALQDDEEPDAKMSTELGQAFEAILAGEPIPTESAVTESESVVAEVAVTEAVVTEDAGAETEENFPVVSSTDGPWNIHFAPGEAILKTGNEPLRMIRELADVGRVDVTAQVDKVPNFTQMDPEGCYLQWDMVVRDRIPKAQIETVFEWVLDESDLTIELASGSQSTPALADDGWSISFKPCRDVLRTGNEPLRMFRELEELGQLTVKCDLSEVPNWSSFDTESCYLNWSLTLLGDCDKDAIDEVFEWVVDDSDVLISQRDAVSSNDSHNDSHIVDAEIKSSEAVAEAMPDNAAIATSEEVTSTAAVDNQTPATVGQPAETANKPAAAKPNTPSSTSSKAPSKSSAKKSGGDTSSIRVGIDKVDNLINMVGELVITQSMLGQLGDDFEMKNLLKLQEGLSQLEQNTRELQESVMRIRMLPISFTFSRFPRMVRDLSRRLGKQIDLELLGEQTELDKTVMEKIGDPMVHLVRNSVDHGIELPDERLAAGKSEVGTVVLNAYHQGGNVVIEITDDGKGLDRDGLLQKGIEKGLVQEKDAGMMTDSQIFDLIFQPGFSTAKEVSDVSGRGVGMDVVRRNIQELNGSVEINSTRGKGSTITIRLPLTLAILDGQLVSVGEHTYIFPLVSIVESLQCNERMLNRVAGGCDVFQLRDEYVPIIRLDKIFDIPARYKKLDEALLVVVECEGEKIGIVVDELLAQQQVVIKSLEQNYKRVEGISGATILGDGTVSLILDIPGLVNLAGIDHQQKNNVMTMSGQSLTQLASASY